MWTKNVETFLKLTRVLLPIIQAPMGGVSTPELIAAISQQGGLGSLAAGYMRPQEIIESIQKIQNLGTQFFSVNLFVPQKFTMNAERIEKSKALFTPYYQKFGIDVETIPIRGPEDFALQVEAVMQMQVPIVSFTFGIPEASVIKDFKAQGALLIGTATSVMEAKVLEDQGMDIIVVQGAEAGGHRGTFINSNEAPINLVNLLNECCKAVKIPLIAAGGIMHGQDIAQAIKLGASAVQMGTAFLVCSESSAAPCYKKRILNSRAGETQLTKVFSGKSARGIVNKVMRDLASHESELPDYPIQHYLTQPLRSQAAKHDDIEYMSLWAGQNAHKAREQSVEELLQNLLNEYQN